MNNRERTRAALTYQPYDRLPVVHFGYWRETLQRWTDEGHISEEERRGWSDGNEFDHAVSGRLGFDFNWYTLFQWEWRLFPRLEKTVIEEQPDGMRKVINEDGVIVMEKTGITSISTEIDHTLRDRASWEEVFKPRLQFSAGTHPPGARRHGRAYRPAGRRLRGRDRGAAPARQPGPRRLCTAAACWASSATGWA